MPPSPEERVQFIQGLNLKLNVGTDNPFANFERCSGTLDMVDDNQPKASVDGASTISFTGDIPTQIQNDVEYSTLFAQLAANYEFNRETETTKWYTHYKTVLETIGWTVKDFLFANVDDANTEYSVNKLLLKLAEAYLEAKEFALFKVMINGLEDAANNAALKLFETSAKSNNQAHFQTGVVSAEGGKAKVKMSFYHFSSAQTITSVLFMRLGDQQVSFGYGNQTMELSDALYKGHRELIVQKLGDHIKQQIKSIVLPPVRVRPQVT